MESLKNPRPHKSTSVRSKMSAALVGAALSMLPAQVKAQQLYGGFAIELVTGAWRNLENTGRTPPACIYSATLSAFPNHNCGTSHSMLSLEIPWGAFHGSIGYRDGGHWSGGLHATVMPGWEHLTTRPIYFLEAGVFGNYRPRARSWWSIDASVDIAFNDPSYSSETGVIPKIAIGPNVYTSRTTEHTRGVFSFVCGATMYPNRPSFGVDAFCTLRAGFEIQ